MYRIKKENGKTYVYDWQDRVVWSAEDESYILYMSGTNPAAEQVGRLSEDQILTCLAKAIKIPV